MSLVEDKQVVEALSSHRLHPPLQNRVRPGALNRSHLLNAETWQTAIESRVVATITDLDRLFAEIKREKGKLDIVFANAGVAKYAPFGEITGDLYEQTFGINVKGVLFTVQKALPLVPDGAAIILNASIVGSKGLPANSVYSATKAAVRSFARTWTTDLKHRRIRVNAVSPGTIETPGLNHLLASSPVGEQRRKMISNAVPLGRFGTPDEIAKAVVSHPTTQATSPERNCSWRAASLRFGCSGISAPPETALLVRARCVRSVGCMRPTRSAPRLSNRVY